MSRRHTEDSKMDKRQGRDGAFRERLLALLEWVAERDPLTAAKLVREFAEDVVKEVGQPPEPAAS